MALIQRTLIGRIKELSKYFSVILMTGPRQIGKTTILEEVSNNRFNYVTLDDMGQREIAKKDPALFIQMHEPPVIIDEVQYAPELFSYIKIYVDTHKDQKGLFYLTGSQKFRLMKGVQESLAGRVAIVDALGLSYGEIIAQPKTEGFFPGENWIQRAKEITRPKQTVQDIFTKIWNGSFPELISRGGSRREDFYSSYVQTYIARDVNDFFKVSNTITFFNFIRVVAARTGQLLNLADIAKDLSIDPKTAKSWLSILELSGLVSLLYPYYNNVTKRIVKTPKLYFMDTGLCSYLTGWDTPKSLELGAMSGAMLETYVYTEILKSHWNNGKHYYLYFYRDKDKNEIDFVIDSNGTLYPVEVKKTLMPDERMVKNFGLLEKLQKPVGHGVVLCLNPDILPINRNVTSVPVWEI